LSATSPTALACAGLLALVPSSAAAFSIASGFSRSCHERLSLAAMAVVIEGQALGAVVLPPDDLWRHVAGELAPAVLERAGQSSSASLTDAQRFLLYSVAVGVRSPDTGGHSVSNLDQLRRAQIDPDPSSQHLHCLRAEAENGLPGDLAVLDDAERLIREQVQEAASLARSSGYPRNIRVPFYLDYYGQLEVEVDRATYLVGRAMHTLQDCYAHTLRNRDARTVHTVLNYLEAVTGELTEARDGMAHSDTLDDCRRSELAPVVDRAARTSTAFARAAVALIRQGDPNPLERGFDGCARDAVDVDSCDWLLYQPGCDPERPEAGGCCTLNNNYCDSPYLNVAREKLTRPYLAEVLSCSGAPGGARPSPGWLPLLLGAWLLGRRRLRRGLVLLLLLATAPVRAEPDRGRVFAVLEGHLSLLSDIPGRSYLDVTTGLALRGGYRRGSWGLLIQVERNLWLPTELSHELDPGALNLALGVERLLLDGHLRVGASAGPSILWFDTALDTKGTVGLFVDLRPAGLRWSPLPYLALVFDPLSLALVAPVLHEPALRQLEYRTLLGAELAL
jgi:hypothetical protein